MQSSGARFLLLGRPECRLCEEFAEELRAHDPAILLEHADVDSRADWRAEFGRRIPVLLDPAGRVICEGRFDPASFAARHG